jgi:hypothetical protein
MAPPLIGDKNLAGDLHRINIAVKVAHVTARAVFWPGGQGKCNE